MAALAASDVRRARSAWLCGAALVLAGFVPVLAFICRSLLPAAEAAAVPDLAGAFPPAWTAGVEAWMQSRRIGWISAESLAGLAPAVPGLLVMLGGATILRRARARLAAHSRRTLDARRRVRHYRGERVEPTLGSGIDSAA